MTVAASPAPLTPEAEDNKAALESLPYDVQGADLNLPPRVIVDQHGHYWRDYGDFLSMPPVSEENVATEVVAAFTLAASPAPALDVERLIRAADKASIGFVWFETPYADGQVIAEADALAAIAREYEADR